MSTSTDQLEKSPPRFTTGIHRLTPINWRGEWGQPLILETPAVLGRGKAADVEIADQWVSRVHCRLTEEDGHLFVTDLDSRHGVFVNDRRVERTELRPGDLLQIGASMFLVDLRNR